MDSTLRHRERRPPLGTVLTLVKVLVAGTPATGSVEIDKRMLLGRAHGPLALGLGTDPHVSRDHVALERVPEGWALENRSKSETLVNGVPIDQHVLSDGDLVMLGHSAFVARFRTSSAAAPVCPGLLGEAPSMLAVRRAIGRVAKTPLSVLLLGESGTGKEVAARAVHHGSGRQGPFVALNCGAIPATLAESQLFGHAVGAFTGAQKASQGVFRAADHGTLFLDEVAELPLELQPKLLRVLEERIIVPVGSATGLEVDVRIVAATNRSIVDEVREGRFRGDLYARLAEFTLELPPLKERPEDLFLLLAHLYGGPLPPLEFDLLRALLLHGWPYNVREVRTVAAQLRLIAADLDRPIPLSALPKSLLGGLGAPPSKAKSPKPVKPPRTEVPTKRELIALLRAHKGVVSDVARSEGRSRKQVYRWIEAHGLSLEQVRGQPEK